MDHTHECKGWVSLSQHQWLLQGQRRKARERPQAQEEEVNALEARLWLFMPQKKKLRAVLESGRAWFQADGEEMGHSG